MLYWILNHPFTRFWSEIFKYRHFHSLFQYYFIFNPLLASIWTQSEAVYVLILKKEESRQSIKSWNKNKWMIILERREFKKKQPSTHSHTEVLFPVFKIDMVTWILKRWNVDENLLIAMNLAYKYRLAAIWFVPGQIYNFRPSWNLKKISPWIYENS